MFTRIAIGAMILFCSCNNMIDEEPSEKVPSPIVFTARENMVNTRAPLSSFNSTTVKNIGIYALAESSTPGTYIWSASPFLANISPSNISGNQLIFASKYYYPKGKRAKFYAFYPNTVSTGNTITPPGNGTPPIYNFTLTGQEDIMYAVTAPSGSINPDTTSLQFNHTLSQIILNVPLLGGLQSVTLNGVKNQGALNLETGVVTYGSSTINIALNVNLLGGLSTPVMVPAGVASYTVVAKLLILSNTYTIKPTSGNFLPGTVYTINL